MRKWTWNKSSIKHKNYKKAPDIVEVHCNPKILFHMLIMCSVTPTQALHLAVAGATGTEKTETTEDLGCALGMMVKTFNDSEYVDDEVRCSVKRYGDCCSASFSCELHWKLLLSRKRS